MKRPVIRILVTAAVLGILVYTGREYLRELGQLRNASPIVVLAMVAVYLVTRLVNGEVMRVALEPLGRTVSRFEAFLVMNVMTYTNLIVPRAGLGAPALYLKRRYDLAYTDFAAMLIPTTLLQLTCTGLVGLASQWFLYVNNDVPLHAGLVLVFAIALLGSLAALYIRLPLPARWSGKLARGLRRLMESWALLVRRKNVVVHVVVAQLAAIALRALRLQLAFVAIDREVNFVGTVIVSLLAQLALLVGITPGALGLREGAICYGYQLLGVPIEIGLTAAVLDRAAMTLPTIPIGQFGLWRMLRLAHGGAPKSLAPDTNHEEKR